MVGNFDGAAGRCGAAAATVAESRIPTSNWPSRRFFGSATAEIAKLRRGWQGVCFPPMRHVGTGGRPTLRLSRVPSYPDQRSCCRRGLNRRVIDSREERTRRRSRSKRPVVMPHALVAFVTDFADQAVILPLIACVAVALWLAGWRRGVAVWCCGTAATLGLMLVLKVAFRACGPEMFGGAIESPSGHTAAAGAVYGSIFAFLNSRLARTQGLTRADCAGGGDLDRRHPRAPRSPHDPGSPSRRRDRVCGRPGDAQGGGGAGARQAGHAVVRPPPPPAPAAPRISPASRAAHRPRRPDRLALLPLQGAGPVEALSCRRPIDGTDLRTSATPGQAALSWSPIMSDARRSGIGIKVSVPRSGLSLRVAEQLSDNR